MFGLSVCVVGCCSSMELKKSIEGTFGLAGGDKVEAGGVADCEVSGDGARFKVNKNTRRLEGKLQLTRSRLSLVRDCPVCQSFIGLVLYAVLLKVGIMKVFVQRLS
jgi:hypothetical protein